MIKSKRLKHIKKSGIINYKKKKKNSKNWIIKVFERKEIKKEIVSNGEWKLKKIYIYKKP
jgi:hypothetical protein